MNNENNFFHSALKIKPLSNIINLYIFILFVMIKE